MSLYKALETAVLHDLGVSPGIPITGDLSPVEVAKVSLANSLLKKREDWPDEMIADQEQAALELWNHSNNSCGNWSWTPQDWGDDIFEGTLKKVLYEVLDPSEVKDRFSIEHIFRLMEPGPGSARLADSDNFFTKMFGSKASVTSEQLLAYFRAAISDHPVWAEAEFNRFERYGVGIVEGSQWFSVPKTRDIRRACATEPSINMLVQKALGRWIEERIFSRFGIDLSSQPNINKDLARIGSTSSLYGTIDLKSASDRIPLSFVEKFLPSSIVGWIRLCRSPTCLLPDGRLVEMNMVSSMGNGFTFPLQTAIFACVVAASYEMTGLPFRRIRKDGDNDWAVFGDDIIVRREAFDSIKKRLTSLNHVVNDQKSFNTGDFRESCGSDWFRGYNVRGVYIKDLSNPLAVYSAINRLVRWSACHGVNLTSALRVLLDQVKFLPVPFEESDIAGIKVPRSRAPTTGIRTPRRIVQQSIDWCGAVPYRACRHRVKRAVVAILSDVNDRRARSRSHSGSRSDSRYHLPGFEAGWTITALGGFCGTPPYIVEKSISLPRPVEIGLREMSTSDKRWNVKWCTTSSWDEVPLLPGPTFGSDRGDGWLAVAGNLEFLKLLHGV